jgi:hypothetical protein
MLDTAAISAQYGILKEPTVMKKSLATLCVMALLLVVPAACKTGPLISVDSEEVNLGTIKQGTRASAKYVFKVKNTGDSVLVIRDVRPG